MTLLELAQDLGLDPKKTSNSKGGEYHSPCPGCGEGADRFMIWPELNRYWCRRCDTNGDAIQFCRDFMKLSYHEARQRINGTSHLPSLYQIRQPITEKLVVAQDPPKIWQEKASTLLEWSHKQLIRSPSAMDELHQRGFNMHTISRFKLGYSINPSSKSQDFFRDRSEWGLPPENKVDGSAKKLWLPSGVVIPTMCDDGSVCKLKVRRQKWHKDDVLPKYVEISGSKACPSIYGNITNQVAVVVEAELDAMLIQQEAQDVCCSMALGGATKKPDFFTDHLLRKFSLILWCLDNDEAGKKAALWWRETYPHLRFWPVPIGKSPGDAFQYHGINLRDWILQGIEHYSKTKALFENLN